MHEYPGLMLTRHVLTRTRPCITHSTSAPLHKRVLHSVTHTKLSRAARTQFPPWHFNMQRSPCVSVVLHLKWGWCREGQSVSLTAGWDLRRSVPAIWAPGSEVWCLCDRVPSGRAGTGRVRTLTGISYLGYATPAWLLTHTRTYKRGVKH